MKKPSLKITFNSPAVLSFTFLCLAVWAIDSLTGHRLVSSVFRVYGSSLRDPLTIPRMFLHVAGHSGFSHLAGNLMYILILGPMLEEKYGTGQIVLLFAVTAFITGFLSWLIEPNVAMCGASGIVFAMIMMASVTQVKAHELPLTLVMTVLFYAGQQVFEWVTVGGGVAYGSHLLGGCVGLFFGLRSPGTKRIR